MSFFDEMALLPEDPILSLPLAFKADPRPNKVNLGVGSYLDDEGLPYVFPCVRTAEEKLLRAEKDKEYAPIDGSPLFIQACVDLVFGAQKKQQIDGRFFAAQALGGAGALRIGAEVLVQGGFKEIYVPVPTWANHKAIFTRAGLAVKTYRYYDGEKHQVDFSALCEDVKAMTAGSAILLHVCCHNPSGIDFDGNQWKALSELLKKQRVFPFFDFAYQGFDRGIEEDAFPVRLFVEQGHELLVTSSYSKNFGLYGERVGLLTVVCESSSFVKSIGSQVRQLIRSNYSNPPRHGALIVEAILSSPELKKGWIEDLANMRMRTHEMRHLFALELMSKGDPKRWSFIEKEHGFFSLLGLSDAQVEKLKSEYAIYTAARGRVNVAGLNQHNIDYVIDSILAVTRS